MLLMLLWKNYRNALPFSWVRIPQREMALWDVAVYKAVEKQYYSIVMHRRVQCG